MSRILVLLFVIFSFPIQQYAQDLNNVDDRGRKQGKWRKTYTTGAIRYEGQFRDDHPYGAFKYYYESSALKALTLYSDDGIVARTKTYHENGKMLAQGKYIRQQKDSTWKYYSDVDGVLVAEENYSLGALNGQSIAFYPDSGEPTEIIEYKNGVKEGTFVKYFPDGNIMAEGKYINDLLQGSYSVYFSDGTIEVKGNYKDGRKTGNWLYFNEMGQPLSEDDYKQESGTE